MEWDPGTKQGVCENTQQNSEVSSRGPWAWAWHSLQQVRRPRTRTRVVGVRVGARHRECQLMIYYALDIGKQQTANPTIGWVW